MGRKFSFRNSHLKVYLHKERHWLHCLKGNSSSDDKLATKPRLRHLTPFPAQTTKRLSMVTSRQPSCSAGDRPLHGQETDLWFSDSSRSGAQAGTWAWQSRGSRSFCSRRPPTLQQGHYFVIKGRGRKPGGGVELGWFTAHRVDWVFEDVVMTLWAHRAAVWWGPVLLILSLTVLHKCSLVFG